MNVTERAREGYSRHASPIRSDRAAEYDAFARITHRLKTAAGTRAADFAGFVAALSDNRRLWTALAADVARPGNALPQDLRARIFWLAKFIESESRRLLAGKGDPAVLCEINAAVLQGLRGQETQQ